MESIASQSLGRRASSENDLNILIKGNENGWVKQEFYDRYLPLVKKGPITLETCQQMQKAKLRAILKKHPRYEIINNFLNYIKKNKISVKLKKRVEKMTIDEAYGRIVQLLNKGLSTDSSKIRSSEEAQNLFNELQNIIEQLPIKESEISENIVNLFANRLGELFPEGGFTINSSIIKDYTSKKAQLIEELFSEIMNRELKRQGIKGNTFTTGNWYGNIDFQSITGRARQQLIEDNITLFADTKFQSSYKIFTKKTEAILQDYDDFLEKIKKISGTETIYLQDEFYKFLVAADQAASITTQAKSGKGFQSILNENNERNTLKLTELQKFYDLKELQNLYKTYEGYFDTDKESNTLKAYANWALAKGISKTNLIRNQLYFTSQGIMTASEWISKSNKVLIFIDDHIKKISSDYFTRLNRYNFISVKPEKV